MEICLIIEQDIELWQNILIRLHMHGFKWHGTGGPLDNFYYIKNIIKYDCKGLGVNFRKKTVDSTCNPTKYYEYFIEVKK